MGSNFKPMYWSKYCQTELKKDLVLANWCDFKFDGEIKQGARLKIVGAVRPTVQKYVKGKDFFIVTKKACNEGININTEYKDCKITQVNGIDYIEYGETRHGYGIIWKKTDINTRFPAIFQVRF